MSATWRVDARGRRAGSGMRAGTVKPHVRRTLGTVRATTRGRSVIFAFDNGLVESGPATKG